MFIQLTDTRTSDDTFNKRINDLKDLYWPKSTHLKEALNSTLPKATEISKKIKEEESTGKKLNEEELILKEISNALQKVSDDAGNKALYKIYGSNGEHQESLPFPFLSRFYRYFFERKWEQPYANPNSNIDEFLHLHPPGETREPDQHSSAGKNYSLNVGNYHHFVNVVAALSRLIRYFSDERNIRWLFEHDATPPVCTDTAEKLSILLSYNPRPSIRKFMLLTAGFYHDIGKTVTNPRHGMEGAIILAFHTTHSRHYLNQIIQKYKELGLWSEDLTFKRADLFYISNLVLFHDQYGTIQTGEDSYLRLADMISELATYARSQNKDIHEDADWTKRFLFDLWLLNIADIMVSIDHKWEEQNVWLDSGKADKRIRDFFSGKTDNRKCTSQGIHLINDLTLSMEMIQCYFEDKCTNDPSEMEARLYNCSRHHSLERIRRLITASTRVALTTPIEKFFKDEIANAPPSQAASKKTELNLFMDQLVAMTNHDLDLSITRSVHSVTDVQEFCRRLAWIGKMDYALGFFQQLGNAALKRVATEILDDTTPPTGWIRKNTNDDTPKVEFDKDFMAQIQAQFFSDNFTAVVIRILSYLLLREESIDRVRNIQFSDAAGRLTEDKFPKLLSLDGPFRAKRVTQLILQTIYVY